MTRNAALRFEIEDAKASHSRLLGLFWQLKNGDELEVGRLVGHIKSGAENLDESLPPRLEHDDIYGQPAGVSGRTAQVHATRSEQDDEIRNRSTIRDLGSTHNRTGIWNDLLPFTHDEGHESPLQQSLRSHLNTIREGFALKCSCISEIFFCHDNIAFENLFNTLLTSKVSSIPSSVLCEMCAVAAVSGQYVRDMLPPSLIDCWYSKLCTLYLIVVREGLGLFECRRRETFLR